LFAMRTAKGKPGGYADPQVREMTWSRFSFYFLIRIGSPVVGARYFLNSAVGSGTYTVSRTCGRGEGGATESSSRSLAGQPRFYQKVVIASTSRWGCSVHASGTGLVSAYREAKTTVRGRSENLVILAVHVAPV
jgi:hypothetical protein